MIVQKAMRSPASWSDVTGIRAPFGKTEVCTARAVTRMPPPGEATCDSEMHSAGPVGRSTIVSNGASRVSVTAVGSCQTPVGSRHSTSTGRSGVMWTSGAATTRCPGSMSSSRAVYRAPSVSSATRELIRGTVRGGAGWGFRDRSFIIARCRSASKGAFLILSSHINAGAPWRTRSAPMTAIVAISAHIA